MEADQTQLVGRTEQDLDGFLRGHIASKLSAKWDLAALRLTSRLWNEAIKQNVHKLSTDLFDIRLVKKYPHLTTVDRNAARNRQVWALTKVKELKTLTLQLWNKRAGLCALKHLKDLSALDVRCRLPRTLARAKMREIRKVSGLTFLKLDGHLRGSELTPVSRLVGLKVLIVDGLYKDAGALLQAIPGNLTSLSLALDKRCLGGDALENDLTLLRRLTGLQALTLEGPWESPSPESARVHGRFLSALSGMSSFSSLRASIHLEDRSLSVLQSMSRLHSLHLTTGSMKEEGLINIAKVTGLQGLYLSGYQSVTMTAISALRQLTRVELVDLTGMLEDGLDFLRSTPSLQWLDLTDCVRVPVEALNKIALATTLTMLDISGCYCLPWNCLSTLSTLTRITYLNLGCNDWVTMVDLAALRHMPSLQELGLYRCPRLSNEALLNLQPYSRLAALSIASNSWLRNDGLEALCYLKKLLKLDIRNCQNVDRVGLQRLCEQLRLTDLMVDYTMKFQDGDKIWLRGLVGACRVYRDIMLMALHP